MRWTDNDEFHVEQLHAALYTYQQLVAWFHWSSALRRLSKVLFLCMYVWGVGHRIQLLHRDLQWSVVLPLLINPLLILHLEWNVGLHLWGHHCSSHFVPWRTGPGDEIWSKLQPHNHIGYVWLIHLLGTFCKWGHLSISVWKGVLLGDSVM
jgi:hypothetical protein